MRDGMSTAQDEHSNAGTGGNVGGVDGNSRRYGGVASVGIPVEFRKEFIHAGSHGLGVKVLLQEDCWSAPRYSIHVPTN